MITNLIKKHSVAISIFFIYLVIWVGTIIQLYDMHKNPYSYGDGKPISFLPVLAFILSIAYLVSLIILSVRIQLYKTFYARLALLVSLPMIAIIIIAIAESH